MTRTALADTATARLASLVDTGVAVGAVAAVVCGDERAVVCRGLRARAAEPVDGATVFEVGSLTKTVTGLLLADMAARGEVAYTDPLWWHLPERARPRDCPVTLVDLATHTAGLPRLPRDFYPKALRSWRTAPYAHYNLDDLYRATARCRPRPAPVRYSTFGVALLGQVLANAAGRPFDQLLTDRIRGPLGMTATTLRLTAPTGATNVATGYRRGRQRPHWTFGALAPAGALCTTGDDLLRYLAANAQPREHPLAGACRAAHQPLRQHRNRPVSTCLVWLHKEVRGRTLLWHSGATGGFTTFMGFCPDTGAGVALMTNTAPTTAQPVLRTARRLFKDIVFAP